MKTNGIQIFGAYTVFMVMVVFGLTAFFKAPDTEEKPDKEPAETVQTAEVKPVEEEKPKLTPAGDPEEADNAWAMFLVNSNNPVPQEYSNSIDTELVYQSDRDFYMDSRMGKYARAMFDAADKDGIHLVMVSAFRTNAYQADLFERSVQDRMDRKGMSREDAEADTALEVQLPGYSEHNSGLATDIMSDEYTSMDDDGFKNTEAYAWLMEHCAEYGFILRYPEGKTSYTGINYEPWHFRFVGVYYAKQIMEKEICLEEFFDEQGWLDKDGVAISHYPPYSEDNKQDGTEDTSEDTDDMTQEDE